MSKSIRAAIVVLLLGLTVIPYVSYADDAPSSGPLGSVVAVFSKSDDVDDKKIDDDLLKAFTARLPELAKTQAMDLRSALSPAAKSALKDDHLKKLFAFPELIAGTDRVRNNILADGLLTARIEAFGKSGKSYYVSADLTFYDFRNESADTIEIGAVDFKAEVGKKDFLASTAGEIIKELQRSVPGIQAMGASATEESTVVCNNQSRMFHSPDSHHLPAESISQKMTRVEAEKTGYRPCMICYPEARKRIRPDSTEAMLGSEVAGFIEYYYRVSNDPQQHARVERIGRKILAANGSSRRNYIFTALNSEEVNAFAAPGGYIYVTTGMLDAAESDDELASVIAHEIAHVEEEHGLRQYRRAQRAAALGTIVSILSGQDLSILSDFVRELVLRGYDRRYESEADRYGYMYLRHTDYDPEAMFTLLGKLQDMELSSNLKIVSFLRTHPKAEDRILSVAECESESRVASKYIAGLDQVDAGLASAVKADELRYVESIDDLKSYVEAVEALPREPARTPTDSQE